jgi:hypothetical protein
VPRHVPQSAGDRGTEQRGIGIIGASWGEPYAPMPNGLRCAVGLRGEEEALLGKMLPVFGNFFPLPFAELG